MNSFENFVPKKSINLLQGWFDDLDADFILSKPRTTKLGDFKVRGNRLIISVNDNLNKYFFLMTITHELAHAFVYKKKLNIESPHDKNWQLQFKSLMLNFLTPDFFPEDILMVLSRHIINPKASTYSDIDLVRVLRKYDQNKSLTLSDLALGDSFLISNGSIFIKGKRLNKRYKCVNKKTKRVYLFHPFATVIKQL